MKRLQLIFAEEWPHSEDPSIMLWGPPGVGKTSIVEQLVTNLGYGLFEWRLDSMTVLDMIGLPFVDKERHLTDWDRTPLVPPPDSSTPSVLFVDEITTAVPAIQAQAYQVFRERRVAPQDCPSGVLTFQSTGRCRVILGDRRCGSAN